jgi:hypothetical protein
MPIVPDDKDWTWVLDRPCPECGFDASTVPAHSVADLIRSNARAWSDLIDSSKRLSERPSDDRWSSLEYACHVRDVFRIYDERLHLMLDEDDPTFANWDQDASAVEDRYNEQNPRKVVRDLNDAAATLAASFDEVSGDQWRRTGTRSDGARFTIDTFGRYMVHDPIHHIWDVEQNRVALEGGGRA